VVIKAARQLAPQLRKELNCIAVNRQGCYVPDSNSITGIFSSKHTAVKLQQVSCVLSPIWEAGLAVPLLSTQQIV